MRRLRIAMFVHTLDDRAVSSVLRRIIPHLQSAGADVALIHATSDPARRLPLPPDVDRLDLRLGRRPTLLGVLRLARLLRRVRPDVLFAHLNGPARSAVIARSLARVRTAIVIVEHIHYSTFYRKRRWLRDRMTAALYPRADLVTGVSQAVVADLAERFPAVASRTAVLPGIGPEPAEVSAALGTAPDHAWYTERDGVRLICCVANVTPRKAQGTIIESLPAVIARVGDVRLVLVGRIDDEEFARQLLARAEALGVRQRVSLAGYQDSPLPFIAHADVFALSSTIEGFSMVLVEALACGVPVVSTDCPAGPREVLEDGRSGLLVPVGDHVAMAEAIGRVMTDRDLRARLVAAGRERARAFTPKAVAEAYLAVATRLASERVSVSGERPPATD